FSCHQQWRAVQSKRDGVKFHDAVGFYRYARELGFEGVQPPLRSNDPSVARQMRALVEQDGGYYEADLRLPKTEGDVAAFEADVRLGCEAGAHLRRAALRG